GLVEELMADAAGIERARAATDTAAVHQDDVEAALAQLEGNGRTDHARADHEDVAGRHSDIPCRRHHTVDGPGVRRTSHGEMSTSSGRPAILLAMTSASGGPCIAPCPTNAMAQRPGSTSPAYGMPSPPTVGWPVTGFTMRRSLRAGARCSAA